MRSAAIQSASTDFLPVADRFAYWADVVAQTFVPLECDSSARSDFSGHIRHRQVGRVGIADVRASAQRVRRTRTKIAQAPSDDLIVVIHVDGRCNTGQRSDVAMLHPGDGALVSARETYFFDFPEPFRQLVLKLPRSLLNARIASGSGCAFRLAHGPAHLLRHLALAVLDGPGDVATAQDTGVERAFGELLCAAAAPTTRSILQAEAASARYEAAWRFIRQNLADPALNPASVAAHVGLSARSLSRLFAVNGQSVERSIWSCRLAAAKNDLADPCLRRRTITQIAFAHGFGDAAHFSRSFADAYGETPRRFRSRLL